MEDFKLNTIEEAIEDFREGKFLIVVDDEDRENEGDLVCAADFATPENIAFMARHACGLICAPITQERAAALNLSTPASMTDPFGTAFTQSVDFRHGTTTGISAFDRSKTIMALNDPDCTASDFTMPGHLFPLIARPGGVLRRTGHTERAAERQTQHRGQQKRDQHKAVGGNEPQTHGNEIGNGPAGTPQAGQHTDEHQNTQHHEGGLASFHGHPGQFPSPEPPVQANQIETDKTKQQRPGQRHPLDHTDYNPAQKQAKTQDQIHIPSSFSHKNQSMQVFYLYAPNCSSLFFFWLFLPILANLASLY